MAEPAAQLRMPSRGELIEEAIARLDSIKVKSQLVELATPDLRDLCIWLTDRSMTVRDAWRQLNTALGGTDKDKVVDDNAVYRFAHRFLPIYGQVRAEHARRIARLSITQATQGNVDAMQQVMISRMAELAAEKMVAINDLEELTTGEFNSVVNVAMGLSNAALKREELALKIADGQRKEAKLQADLDKMRADIRAKDAKLLGQVEQLTRKLDQVEGMRAKGQSIDPAIFADIRAQLVALAVPSPAQAEEDGSRGGAADAAFSGGASPRVTDTEVSRGDAEDAKNAGIESTNRVDSHDSTLSNPASPEEREI